MASELVLVDMDMGGTSKVKNLPLPTGAGDAVPKSYVDANLQGLSPKPSVRAISTAAIAAPNGLPIIDGYQTVAGDRVLLTGQAAATQNGIWIAQAGAWVRPADFMTGADATGAWVFVEGPVGSANIGQYAVIGEGPNIIDTANLVWSRVGASPALRRVTTTIGDGATTIFNIQHNLGTLDVLIQVYLIATGATVDATEVRVDVNNAQVSFNAAPAANAYRVVIIG